MTIINRFCPEVSDIVAVQLQCKRCRSSLSYPPDTWKPGDLKCTNCGVTLVSPAPNSRELRALEGLVDALRELAKPDGLEFQLRLEFNRDDQ
jgi:hypothetical protein